MHARFVMANVMTDDKLTIVMTFMKRFIDCGKYHTCKLIDPFLAYETCCLLSHVYSLLRGVTEKMLCTTHACIMSSYTCNDNSPT